MPSNELRSEILVSSYYQCLARTARQRLMIGLVHSWLVTFFYPSTEWLVDQPFDCTCGALVRYHPFQITRYLLPCP